nr:deoxyribonuclease-2-alpha [Chelonoidis abingdonii]
MLPLFLLAVALPLPLPRVAAGGISCYDDAGQPVDWFLAYKLPRPRHSPPAEGMRYMYQDARSGGWVPGRALMNSTQSAVGRTLLQLYQGANRRTERHGLYPVQRPAQRVTSPPAPRGHTKRVTPPRTARPEPREAPGSTTAPKQGENALELTQTATLALGGAWGPGVEQRGGAQEPADFLGSFPRASVVLLDRAQGFWLLHKHPPLPAPHARDLRLAHSGLHNGQSLPVRSPYPYAQFKEDWPRDACPCARAPWNRSVALTPLGGRAPEPGPSSGVFHDDLYSGWVAQALSSDLYVQFWPNSRGVLPSNCSGSYRVYNIEELGFPAPGPHFSATVDHSKWCVSTEHAPGWACVGDMNRNLEEEQRGGGTLCQQDPAVWKSYCALVQSYSKC